MAWDDKVPDEAMLKAEKEGPEALKRLLEERLSGHLTDCIRYAVMAQQLMRRLTPPCPEADLYIDFAITDLGRTKRRLES